MNLLENYLHDLVKSIKTPLLLEINKKDIETFLREISEIENFKSIAYKDNIVLTTAIATYDKNLKDKESTNVLYIDANKNKNDGSILVLETLFDKISSQLQTTKNLDVVKQTAKSIFSTFTGGLLKDHIGKYIDEGVNQVIGLFEGTVDEIVDNITEDLEIDLTEEILNRITSQINNILNETTSNFIDELENKKLYLSKDAKEKLNKLSNKFKKDMSPLEIFSLTLKLIIATTIDSKKIIIVNNPYNLDQDSIAILSLLFSFAKDLKDQNKHVGISVIYIYSNEKFQPYQKVEDKYKDIKLLLDEQRRFTQRYGMLERPSSDIPTVAVKSSMFVGRQQELKHLKDNFIKSMKDRELKNLEVIKADPGVGKTKLVKKHIEQIRHDIPNGQKIIQLQILNQVGHNSSNTGLSSLKDSIVKEAKRLATLKNLEQKTIDKVIDFSKNQIVDSIEEILGINNIIQIAGSLGYAMNLKKNTLDMFDRSRQDLNYNKNTKEEEFENIKSAILKLQELSDNSLPIVLFIDDLQWIDDTTSEFILKHFTKIWSVNPYMVSTLRASDATTALTLVKQNPTLNSYKIELLQQAKIVDENPIKSLENIIDLTINEMNLGGFNEDNLIELISLVIQGDNQKHKTLAHTIIDKISTKDKKYVITLFAVETINMICDKKLYVEQKYKDKNGNEITKYIDKLILQNPLRYNEEVEFQDTLNEVFEIIEAKYHSSLSHYNDTTNEKDQKFNLMAYAVLEERLHILQIYFKEYGNAAVNTLLFSSLLGTPFNSQIVKNVLKELSNTDKKLLQSLKEYINASTECKLEDSHYEIIEEVYEILSRYISFSNAYEYKHNLLYIFLDKQLEYILNSNLNKTDIIHAKDKLYQLILANIGKEKKEQDFYKKHINSISLKQYTNLTYFLILRLNVLNKAIQNNEEKWISKYIIYSLQLANLFKNIDNIAGAINILKRLEIILKKLYSGNELKWAKSYTTTLDYLSYLYYYEHDILEVIYLKEKVLDIKKSNYEINKDIWAKDYVKSLIDLASTYRDIGKTEKSIPFENEAVEISQSEYHKNENLWVNLYVNSLLKQATTYKDNGNKEKSIELNIKSLDISTKHYTNNSSEFIEIYLRSLNNLSKNYASLENYEDAEKYVSISVNKLKELYDKNPKKWAKEYIINSNTLLDIYKRNKQISKSIDIVDDILNLTRDLYFSDNKNKWIKYYAIALINRAESYLFHEIYDSAFLLLNECLPIIEEAYKKNSTKYKKLYITCLENIKEIYKRKKDTQKEREINEMIKEIINL